MSKLSTNLTPAQLVRREQIGEQRRAKMRRRLLAGAYRLFAVYGADTPTIDDVIAEAATSRGTFYNHFATRDELFRAVADDIASSINDVIKKVTSDQPDPAARLAMAFRMFVRHALADQARGWILLRTLPLVGPLNEGMKRYIHAEFDAALTSGRLHAPSTSIAVDLGMGLQIMTIHRLLVEPIPLSYVEQAAETLLIALGMKPRAARQIANVPLPVLSVAKNSANLP